MMLTTTWPWVALLLLGALHGLNPGMGWLFAVALGMQQGERRAVWRALIPLTLGHAAAIAAAVALASVLGLVVPLGEMRWIVAGALAILGLRQIRRHRHPRVGGMRVGTRDLVAWSFLVATAHGAGLMSVPFAAEAGAVRPPVELHAGEVSAPMAAHTQGLRAALMPAGHGSHATASVPGVAAGRTALGATVAATLVHTLGYVLITGLLAVVVYERAGVGVLRRMWINLDLVWAIALLATAGAIVVL